MVTNQIVDVAEMRRFLTDCLTSIKCDPSHAADLVDLLVEADHTGHYSHGLNRIRKFRSFLNVLYHKKLMVNDDFNQQF